MGKLFWGERRIFRDAVEDLPPFHAIDCDTSASQTNFTTSSLLIELLRTQKDDDLRQSDSIIKCLRYEQWFLAWWWPLSVSCCSLGTPSVWSSVVDLGVPAANSLRRLWSTHDQPGCLESCLHQEIAPFQGLADHGLVWRKVERHDTSKRAPLLMVAGAKAGKIDLFFIATHSGWLPTAL